VYTYIEILCQVVEGVIDGDEKKRPCILVIYTHRKVQVKWNVIYRQVKRQKRGLFLGLYGRVQITFQPVEKLFVELIEP